MAKTELTVNKKNKEIVHVKYISSNFLMQHWPADQQRKNKRWKHGSKPIDMTLFFEDEVFGSESAVDYNRSLWARE